MRFNQKWEARIVDNNDFAGVYFPARVPGNLQSDYARFVGIDDIMYSDNTEKLKNTENSTFEYRTFLHYETESDEKVYFVAEGIDYRYDIILNGQTLYSGVGMYTKAELDITDSADIGSELVVRVYPHPKKKGSRIGSREEAVDSCKPPVCYGWDWNPRLLTSGMWLPAYIETRRAGFISKCEPFYKLSEDLKTAEVSFSTECDADVTYSVYDPDGKLIYEGKDPKLSLDNVKLWWCNGQGEPNLYRWKAATASDEKSGYIGFKKLRLLRNKGTETEPAGQPPKSRYAVPITVELNNRRIFAQGSNFVNTEIFVGESSDEQIYDLVKLAKEANMNILRVWGGAGMAKPAFYDACDKLGLLVWQEFMLACNSYTDNPDYLKILEQEASSVILLLRGHVSLAFWCGGNELFNNWSGMDDQSKPLRLLNKLCYELDYERPFLTTSPLEGMAHGGYLFRYDDGRDVFRVFSGSHFTAYSEFGVPSITPVEQLKKIIPEDELFPIKETKSWVHHHGFNAWGQPRWLCLNVIRRYFGEPNSLEEAVKYSGIMQEVGYKVIFEEARRQWPYCSMALNWCFNEPWITAANNSVVAYPLIKKPGYYGIKEALRPFLASARIPKFDWKDGEIFSAELWYLNETVETVSDKITASIKIGEEIIKVLEWDTGEVEPLNNKLGPSIHFKLPRIEGTELFELILDSQNNVGSRYTLAYSVSEIPKPTYLLNT